MPKVEALLKNGQNDRFEFWPNTVRQSQSGSQPNGIDEQLLVFLSALRHTFEQGFTAIVEQLNCGDVDPAAKRRIGAAVDSFKYGLAKQRSTEALMPSLDGERIYSPDDAAKKLDLNVQTVRKHCRTKRFGFQDESGRWWIRAKEIEAFLLARKKIHGK